MPKTTPTEAKKKKAKNTAAGEMEVAHPASVDRSCVMSQPSEQVVGQYHPSVDMERMRAANRAYRRAQRRDRPNQQVTAAFQQIDGEKIGAAGKRCRR